MSPDWLGSPQHVVGGIVLSAIAVLIARRWIAETWLVAFVAIATTALAEILIEVLEYPVLYRNAHHVSAYFDTIVDMTSTMVGGLIGTGATLLVVHRRRT